MEPGWSDSSALVTIKLLPTLIWFFFVCCIVALPVLGMRRRFRWAAAVGTIVTIACVIVALNDFRCPLTNVAARYTTGWASNFDIYLPVWLAANNRASLEHFSRPEHCSYAGNGHGLGGRARAIDLLFEWLLL